MAKGIELEGIVTEKLPKELHRVEVDLPNGKKAMVLATKAGKMRMHSISILPGDKVTVEVSPYDFSRGRITYRAR